MAPVIVILASSPIGSAQEQLPHAARGAIEAA